MDIRMEVEQLMATEVGPFVPRLMAAAGIVLVAWVLSRLVRATVSRLAQRTGLERRLQTPGLAGVLVQVATGLVWLLALPALLGTLQLQALLDPVNVMMSRLMGYVPSLFGAVVILGVGWLAARILRQIVEGLLIAAGSENLAERLGLGSALGERKLASLAGSAVFLLVMLPTLTAGLQALGLEAVARPVGQMLDAVVALVPRLVSAGLIVGIGALLGRVVAGVVVTALVGPVSTAGPRAWACPTAGGSRGATWPSWPARWSCWVLSWQPSPRPARCWASWC
ncbi:mechanosensitive ion channel [Aquabacterium parvum]|uniref:mechanosensitive ion channel n=1 Tax=Aquabacterium parvum TaxID=70584 RepID=UPI000718F2BD|nr:mechanosensitive ion channel [Aquabacterium parvum]MBU0914900.1 mechanosensitive ion channel [Gammaproteobacteria bacterium]